MPQIALFLLVIGCLLVYLFKSTALGNPGNRLKFRFGLKRFCVPKMMAEFSSSPDRTATAAAELEGGVVNAVCEDTDTASPLSPFIMFEYLNSEFENFQAAVEHCATVGATLVISGLVELDEVCHVKKNFPFPVLIKGKDNTNAEVSQFDL